MNPLLYACTTRQTLSETLDGGKFSWAPFVAGGQAYFGLRFAKRRDGKSSVTDLEVVAAFAALGRWDERPASGTTKIQVGPGAQADGVNTTASIAAGISAADLATALNATSAVGTTYPAATVTLDNGTYILHFDGHPDEIEIAAVENELEPVTLLRVVSYEKGGEWYYALRFIQAPVAFDTLAERKVPDAPTVERVRGGSEIDGVPVNEVQALVRPSEFRGNFEILRGTLPTVPLSRADGSEQIQAALAPLADEGGNFVVTNPQTDEAWIEFDGEMGGQAQDLLTVNVPRAPQGDWWIDLDLDHAEIFALLREKNEVKVPLHLHIIYEDPADSEVMRHWDYIDEVTVLRPVYYTGMEVASGIDFLKPAQESYVPHPVGSTITGNQHYVADFPKSGDVGATAFVHTHDLGSEDGHIAIRRNAGSGQLLVNGVDYTVTFDNAAQLTVTLLSGGYFADPIVPPGDNTKFSPTVGGDFAALGALAITYTTAGPRSAMLAHTQAMSTVDGLVAALGAMQGEIDALQLLAPSGELALRDPEQTVVSNDALPQIFEIYPALGDVTVPESGEFGDLDLEDDGVFPGGLLPAVHDASVDPVSGILSGGELPDPDSVATDQVWENQGVTNIDIFGGRGHRGEILEPGDFVASDGNVFYRVENFGSESSYYPTKFNRLLWWIAVNEKQLRSKRQLLADFAIRTAMLRSDSAASWELAILLGTYPADTSPGTPGPNLQNVVWDVDNPALSQQIIVGPVAGVHRFGARVRNEGGGTITMDKIIYGDAEAAVESDRRFGIE